MCSPLSVAAVPIPQTQGSGATGSQHRAAVAWEKETKQSN